MPKKTKKQRKAPRREEVDQLITEHPQETSAQLIARMGAHMTRQRFGQLAHAAGWYQYREWRRHNGK
jgi:hypothetical protein